MGPMTRMLYITRRELGAYFGSPIFWVIAAAFIAFSNLVFVSYITPGQMGQPAPQASIQPFIGLYGTIFLFVAPLLAMRLLSEEQRSGTLELLMTSPVRDWHVVLGKWLAALVVGLVIIATTLLQVFIMNGLAAPKGIDVGPTVTGYVGLLLLVATLLAVGVLTSALTENQVVAAFLAIIASLALWFLGFVGQAMASPDSVLGAVLNHMGLLKHLDSFNQGTLDTRDILYFAAITVGALYLATRVLESRRWR